MFEAFKDVDGTYRWRIRDENGEIVKITLGKMKLPPVSAEFKRRSRAAMQKILKERVEAQAREA